MGLPRPSPPLKFLEAPGFFARDVSSPVLALGLDSFGWVTETTGCPAEPRRTDSWWPPVHGQLT